MIWWFEWQQMVSGKFIASPSLYPQIELKCESFIVIYHMREAIFPYKVWQQFDDDNHVNK